MNREYGDLPPEEVTFGIKFDLNEIDQSFFFDESQIGIEESIELSTNLLEPNNQSAFFSEWLSLTVPVEEIPAELPQVFQLAEMKGKLVADQLKGVSKASLSSVGGVFSSLTNIIGACGPICGHALGGLGQVSAPAFSGTDGLGFSVDGNGNFSLSGNVDSLAGKLGIPREALLSGKYSAMDILTLLFSSFGEVGSTLFGLGLLGGLLDMLIPGPSQSLAA